LVILASRAQRRSRISAQGLEFLLPEILCPRAVSALFWNSHEQVVSVSVRWISFAASLHPSSAPGATRPEVSVSVATQRPSGFDWVLRFWLQFFDFSCVVMLAGDYRYCF
jgi:hypothetical protein